MDDEKRILPEKRPLTLKETMKLLGAELLEQIGLPKFDSISMKALVDIYKRIIINDEKCGDKCECFDTEFCPWGHRGLDMANLNVCIFIRELRFTEQCGVEVIKAGMQLAGEVIEAEIGIERAQQKCKSAKVEVRQISEENEQLREDLIKITHERNTAQADLETAKQRMEGLHSRLIAAELNQR